MELRRCAHRPRELSLQARGRPRSTPVCAVLIVTYHTSDCLDEDSSHLPTRILSILPSSRTSCSQRHVRHGQMEAADGMREHVNRLPSAGLAGRVSLPLFTFVYTLAPTRLGLLATAHQLSSRPPRIPSLVSIAVASFTRSRLYNICRPKWFLPLGSPSSAKPPWSTSPKRLAWKCMNNNR